MGDCHSHFTVLDEILTREEPFDYFLSVGDLGVIPTDVINKWSSRGFSIYGNHDVTESFPRLSIYHELDNLKICGLNGMIKSRTFIRDTSTNISFREILYASHLSNIDILVTHQPPSGIFEDMGEAVLDELVRYMVPKLYIFGHTHKYRLKFYLNTFLLSLPILSNGYGVVYFENEKMTNIEIIIKKNRRMVRI